MDPVVSTAPLSGPRCPTSDPFLFCVFHEDRYPAGDALMQAPVVGNGSDFDNAAPFRMYHGTRVPGFPQHPHRGFETVTATLEGTIDHTDSLGNAGRYGGGDLQWMSAGRGIVHSEMFPLVNADRPNTLRLFQIWLNLPARSKMTEPQFVMHWSPSIPRVTSPDGLARIAVWAGSLLGATALPPPPMSWAANPQNDVGIWYMEISPGGQLTLPPAMDGSNRSLYLFEGDALQVGPRTLKSSTMSTLHATVPVTLHNAGTHMAAALVLQGKPINEPVAQHGPFVMNTQQEIRQAFADYQRTQFGGWPWPKDDMAFPREKGRFALMMGVESYPPPAP